MKIGFIGAGKVGCSLGRYFVERQVPVIGYYSRHPESAQDAANFTKTEFFDDVSKLVEQSDAIFVTVPDGQISSVYDEIRKLNIKNKQICHCSGAMTAREAFSDIAEHGAFGYSIHPLFPVSSKYESFRELKDAFFCLEGDEKYLGEWMELFQGFGNPTRVIDGTKKTAYHAACAISSNLVCALVSESISLLLECGFSEEEALQALMPLAKSNINKVFQVGPKEALTGPVERCDVETVRKHLDCFLSEEQTQMYRAVSRCLVKIAKERHPDVDYSSMGKVIN